MTRTETYNALVAADNAWHAELVRLFGEKGAVEARYKASFGEKFRGRYNGAGEDGTALRDLYIRYRIASEHHWMYAA